MSKMLDLQTALLDLLYEIQGTDIKLIIGGGMANTFLAAKGFNMQDSLVEAGSIDMAKSILKKSGNKLLLPVDAVIADKFEAEANNKVVDVDKVPAGWRIMDIGPKSIEAFKVALKGAKLIDPKYKEKP